MLGITKPPVAGITVVAGIAEPPALITGLAGAVADGAGKHMPFSQFMPAGAVPVMLVAGLVS